jgi:cytochrome c oxidase assembly factor CtaG
VNAMSASMAAHMAEMGLLTSVLAPAIVLATRRRWSWKTLTRSPALVLPLFVLLHAAITIGMDETDPRPALHLLLHAALLAGAVVFWLPVLGPRSRLGTAARCVYLFLAAPALDLAAVVVVARGDSVGGLAMIVAMLPIGFTAVVMIWRWMQAEERDVRAQQVIAAEVARPEE